MLLRKVQVMEEKLGQLLQMYQAWIALAQEARYLATDEAREPANDKALALMGYYTAIAEVWESAAGDLLQWIEAVEKAPTQRRY